eukprot:GHVQ01036383.1.p1 GENE.GHVQ01036383.1~~GHVQ01036383.1.p1  ORF type:complete len:412 (-),score=55.41 GHVQ01036383.1:668-1903(-)
MYPPQLAQAYPASPADGELYRILDNAFRSTNVDVFVGTPVAFFLSPTDLTACGLVCKMWFSELYSLPKLQFFFNRGIPERRRQFVWRMLLLGESTFCSPECYQSLASAYSSCDSDISRDIGRTYPDEIMFQSTEGQTVLHRLLRASSLHTADVGYCQGMNFIAATLLLVFDEVTAFQCLQSLMLRYGMKDFYLPSFPRLKVTVFQLDRLVEAFLPNVHTKLASFDIHSDFYSMRWFMTLFAYDIPRPTLLHIWDQFLLKGWKVIFKVGLALLYHIQDQLITMQFDEALKFLKVFPQELQLEESILTASDQFCVTTKMLDALQRAYEMKLDAVVMCLKDLDSNTLVWEVKTMACRNDNSSSTDTRRSFCSSTTSTTTTTTTTSSSSSSSSSTPHPLMATSGWYFRGPSGMSF